jgi:hypothetical protein
VRYNALVAALASELVYTVQDLYDLFQRHNPLGGYRHSLFHDTAAPARSVPPEQAEGCRLAYSLARGVSCLLANDLPEAALALVAELWRQVLRQEQAQAGADWREPEYYRFLSAELSQPATGDGARADAYRLFGEVLAVQLDNLAAWLEGADGTPLRQRTACLRRELHG